MLEQCYVARFAAIVLCMLSACADVAWSQTATAKNPVVLADKSDRAAMKLAVKQLAKSHVSHRKVDEELYRRTLDRILWTLDPRRMFLFDADVKPFYDNTSANAKALREGDPSFAFTLANLWVRRVGERLPTIVDLSNRPLLDQVNDLSVIESADLNFTSNNRALHGRCRQWLRFEQQVFRQSGVPHAEIQSQLIDRYRGLLPSKTDDYWLDVRSLLLDSLARASDNNSRYFSEEHLCYLNPRWKGEEAGIGVSLHWQKGSLTVREVFPGSPAYRDGRLHRGDKILAFSLDDSGNVVLPAQVQHTHRGLSFNGKIGSSIRLVVLPRGTTTARNYRIVRAKTPQPEHVTSAILSGDQLPSDPGKKLGYVRLSSFFLDIQVARRKC